MKISLERFVQSTAIAATAGFLSLSNPVMALAAGGGAGHGHDTQAMAMILIVLAVVLISGKVFHLVERIQQPPVVGELLAGIVLGNIALLGFPLFREFNSDTIIQFLAQLGVILLLFQIGLEANIKELLKVGSKSAIVAIAGAVLPFVITTFFIAPMLMPGQPFITYLFTGATMVATSVGIGVRVFKDMGKLKSKAATIFLGATIIDDILSLIILAVITPMAAGAEISSGQVGFIFFKAIGFLVASIIVGQLAAPYIGKMFAKVHTGQGSKFTLSISLALIFGALASFLSLEPIIGAFAAGLVLDPVHFKDFKDPELVEEIKGEISDLTVKQRKIADRLLNIRNILRRHSHNSVEDLIAPLGLFLVPIFFVTTGISVQLESLARLDTIGLALLLTLVAYATKFIGGMLIGGRTGMLVGLAMIPRGEVGLIFATLGKSLGVFNDQIFSVIVVTVLLTTVGAPALLMNALKETSTNVLPKLPKLKLAKLWVR